MADAPQPLLRLAGVGKQFGGVVALNAIELEVAAGEIVSVIGPNGAGKTTLFNVVTGAYTPDAGTIELAGRRIDGVKPHRIVAMGMARTFQNIRLFRSLSVSEHLQIALGAGTNGGGRCVSIGKDGDGQVDHIVVVPGEIKQIEQALGQARDVLGGIRKLDFVGREQFEYERGKTVSI